MRHSPLVAFAALLLPLSVAAQPVRELTTSNGGSVAYSRDPNTVILALIEEPGELRVPGAAPPSVRIFGDGRALIHYPAHMKNAGDFELRLTETEVDELIKTVGDQQLPDIDVGALRQRKRDITAERRRNRQVLHETSDATVSTVEVELAQYQPTAAARRPSTRVKRSLRWSGLQFDAEHMPEVTEIRNLNDMRNRLNAIAERPDRRRLR